jgi:hypothetical protein
MKPLAFHDLRFCYISSRIHLLGRLVSAMSAYRHALLPLLTSSELATGHMHLRRWQVRACVVSSSSFLYQE